MVIIKNTCDLFHYLNHVGFTPKSGNIQHKQQELSRIFDLVVKATGKTIKFGACFPFRVHTSRTGSIPKKIGYPVIWVFTEFTVIGVDPYSKTGTILIDADKCDINQ